MTEISNKTLALLILATLAVVVTATSVQLGGFTGFATSNDTGTVTLDIEQNLEIQVVQGTIDFGSCSVITGQNYTISSTDSQPVIDANCTGAGSFPTEIQVRNVGNVDADVNLSPECDLGDWLVSPSGHTQFNVSTTGGSCDANTGGYVPLETASAQIVACNNLTPTSQFDLDVAIQIAPDTSTGPGCGGNNQNQLTFYGIDAS